MPKPDFKVLLVTDRAQVRTRSLLWVIEEALDAGVRGVQLREKTLLGRDLLSLAEQVSRLCEVYGAALLINDRIDIALAVDAAGVHLGSASVDIETARRLLGAKKLIGLSTHAVQECLQAQEQGADFVLFGPVYFTPSKAAFGAPQGLNRLTEVVEKSRIPVYAIGGIKPEHVPAVKQTGVFGVAVISAIVSAEAPKAAAQQLVRMMASL